MTHVFASLPLRSFLRGAFRNVKGRLGDEGARYDHLAFSVMRRIIQPDSNCIDVGCHKGLYLDRILRLAPCGTHAAFEPLPELSALLRTRYAEYANVAIHEV